MSDASKESNLIVAFYSASSVKEGFGCHVARTPDGKEIYYTIILDAHNASFYTRSDKQVVYEGPENGFNYFATCGKTKIGPDFDHLDASLFTHTFATVERGVRRQFGFEP